MKKLAGLSVVLPAYNDEKTIAILIGQLTKLLPGIASTHEIIVVNDASTDDTEDVLKKLQEKVTYLRIITHVKNKGYGAALTRGFREARKQFIFYTDSDGQYDVKELANLVKEVKEDIDMVAGFKIKRSDPWFRKLIGSIYNHFVKMTFGLKVRDVDCDFRLFRRNILKGIQFQIKSGAFDVEFVRSVEKKKIRYKEVAVHHYPRLYGHSQFFHIRHIVNTLIDIGKLLIT